MDENDTASLLVYYYQNAALFRNRTSEIASSYNHNDLAEHDRKKADEYLLKYELLSSTGIEQVNRKKMTGYIEGILEDHFPLTK